MGCDYDQVRVIPMYQQQSANISNPQAGLHGCGYQTARGILKYGLGRTLIRAIEQLGDGPLHAFLEGWREQLRQRLLADPLKFIGRKRATLASSLPSTFPNVAIARAFLQPALLTSTAYAVAAQPKRIDFARIGPLCELFFSWGNRAEILGTIRTSIWPDEVMRMLICESVSRTATTAGVEVSHTVVLMRYSLTMTIICYSLHLPLSS